MRLAVRGVASLLTQATGMTGLSDRVGDWLRVVVVMGGTGAVEGEESGVASGNMSDAMTNWAGGP